MKKQELFTLTSTQGIKPSHKVHVKNNTIAQRMSAVPNIQRSNIAMSAKLQNQLGQNKSGLQLSRLQSKENPFEMTLSKNAFDKIQVKSGGNQRFPDNTPGQKA